MKGTSVTIAPCLFTSFAAPPLSLLLFSLGVFPTPGSGRSSGPRLVPRADRTAPRPKPVARRESPPPSPPHRPPTKRPRCEGTQAAPATKEQQTNQTAQSSGFPSTCSDARTALHKSGADLISVRLSSYPDAHPVAFVVITPSASAVLLWPELRKGKKYHRKRETQK